MRLESVWPTAAMAAGNTRILPEHSLTYGRKVEGKERTRFQTHSENLTINGINGTEWQELYHYFTLGTSKGG